MRDAPDSRLLHHAATQAVRPEVTWQEASVAHIATSQRVVTDIAAAQAVVPDIAAIDMQDGV
jgi:hypothetical protein